MDPLGRYLALPFIILGDFFMWFLRGIPTGQGVGLRYLAYRPFTKCLGKVKFHEDVIVSGLAARRSMTSVSSWPGVLSMQKR